MTIQQNVHINEDFKYNRYRAMIKILDSESLPLKLKVN